MTGNHVNAGQNFGEDGENAPRQLVTISAAEVRPRGVEWTWKGRIPRGMLTLGVGVGGLGKTLALVCDLAAQVTRGTAVGDLNGTPRRVLISSAEDAFAETLVPRLIAAGADRQLVDFISMSTDGARESADLTFPRDCDALARMVEELDSALVLIDPIIAHLDRRLNSHSDHEIRRALRPLHEVAERTGAAIVGIAHLNKRDNGGLYERINGSSGLYNAFRSVLLVATDPDGPEVDDGSRVLIHGKCNVGPLAPAYRFRVEERKVPSDDGPIITAGVVWGDEDPNLDAERALSHGAREEVGALAEARAWLLDTLEPGVARPAVEVQQQAEADGIKGRTLSRAARDLPITRGRPEGINGPWSWTLEVEQIAYSPKVPPANTQEDAPTVAEDGGPAQPPLPPRLDLDSLSGPPPLPDDTPF